MSELSAVVIVVWYTTSLTRHSPLKGHLFGSLQLRGLGSVVSSGGNFFLRNILLCASMVCFMLGEQL